MNRQGRYTFKVWNAAGTDFIDYSVEAWGEADAKAKMISALSYTYDWKSAESKLIGFEETGVSLSPAYNSTGYSTEQWLHKIEDILKRMDERMKEPRL